MCWGQKIWLQIMLLFPSVVSIAGAWPPEVVWDKLLEGEKKMLKFTYLSIDIYIYLSHPNQFVSYDTHNIAIYDRI